MVYVEVKIISWFFNLYIIEFTIPGGLGKLPRPGDRLLCAAAAAAPIMAPG